MSKARLHPQAESCGKVILFGEHSVVYGQPALAAGLPRGLELSAKESADANAPSRLRIPEWEIDLPLQADEDHPVAKAARAVLQHCEAPISGWEIDGRAHLPARAGLGSSATLGVAMARLGLGAEAPVEAVVEAAIEGEKIFHGTPSGLDCEIAARGGLISFTRGGGAKDISIPTPLSLVIAPSKIPRSTAEQVANVKALFERRPKLIGSLMDTLGALVGEVCEQLESGDQAGIGESMNIAHELLSALGVSIPKLDNLCACARGAGALGAKLTGAGGGGCILALVDSEHGDGVLDSLRPLSNHPFAVEVGS